MNKVQTISAFLNHQATVGSVIDIHGLRCVVETPQFTLRVGKDFISPSPAHYGYIDGYIGADGDEVDCYVGTYPNSKLAYVIDQNKTWKPVFDEHKVMLCFHSKNEALQTYYFGHTSARRIIRSITTLDIDELKDWLKRGNKEIPIHGTGWGRRYYTPIDWWKYFGT